MMLILMALAALIVFDTVVRHDQHGINLVSEMTYTVLRGTLNSTIPYHTMGLILKRKVGSHYVWLYILSL